METFIEEFTKSFDLEPPSGCVDTELFLAIKAMKVCRLDAWDDGTPFHEIGKQARAWFGESDATSRLLKATREPSPEMRSESVGIYIVGQRAHFLDVARRALADSDWAVRCAVCEALHDLGLNDTPAVSLKNELMDLATTDPHFIVRSRASEALRYYVFDDVAELLQSIAENDRESYGQYMVDSPAAAAKESLAYLRKMREHGG